MRDNELQDGRMGDSEPGFVNQAPAFCGLVWLTV